MFRENNTSDNIKDYTDSDFADEKISCKLTEDYVFNLVKVVISYSLEL